MTQDDRRDADRRDADRRDADRRDADRRDADRRDADRRDADRPQADATKRASGDKHQGAARTSPYPVSRLAPAHDLVDVAREIERADRTIGTVVGSQLEVIARQIRGLQDEARGILERARRDLDLHRAQCSFVKRPGGIYHLYERADGTLYFSMLSPEDWKGSPPHPFRGSFRLEADRSWTPLEEVDGERESPRELARRLLEPSEG